MRQKNNLRVDREKMKRARFSEQLGHFTQPAEGRHRDHFLPPLTPSLSSVSLPSLLSLHIYKATGFTYRPTGKHAAFQPAVVVLLTLACWRQAWTSALSLQ